MTQDNASGGQRGLRASLSPELIETVCSAYGFDHMDNAVDIGGSSCLNLLVENNNHRCVVRIYRPYVTKARLDDIQRIRRQLIAGGVPCANPLLTQDGRSWIAFNDRLIEIEHYLDHDSCMDSWERLEAALPRLGHIHNILQDTPSSQETKHPPFANYIDPQVMMERTLRGTQRIRGWASSALLLQLADKSEELANRLKTVGYDNLNKLPKQLVHGDYWDNNVLFHQGDIVLVTDFDFMGERTRINDLALTLYFATLKYEENPVSKKTLIQLGQLVAAYDSGLSEPLSATERDILPLALASQPLWSIGGWVALLDDEAAAQEHAAGTLWAVDWALEIVRHLDRWQTAFA